MKNNVFNIEQIRSDFPILNQKVNGKQLVYFDNAATSQKPAVVIEALDQYYSKQNANIHRGVHHLSQLATDAYEEARIIIQKHLNARNPYEIIYTSGTTQAINLVATTFSDFVKKGDEIIISHLEHHSNIVPWQMLCQRTGANLRVIPMLKDGSLDISCYKDMLNEKTKLVAVNHISNALGTINPVEEIIRLAKTVGAVTLIDGAQSVPHLCIDVQVLDCDFYVFSGHKVCGPTGTGILYGKEEWLEKLPPYLGGGEMIKEVTFEKTTYAGLPHKFEAGTPHIAGGIVLGTALEYINKVGLEAIGLYENELLTYATDQLNKFDGIQFFGTAEHKASVLSFNFENIHPYDVGVIVDKLGIAVRTGHHCAQPIMQFYDIPGTIRASFAFYNTKEEIDIFVEALKRAQQMLM